MPVIIILENGKISQHLKIKTEKYCKKHWQKKMSDKYTKKNEVSRMWNNGFSHTLLPDVNSGGNT